MTRILLVLPNNPGDVLMGLACARGLRLQYPEATIGYIVDQECKGLVHNSPDVDQIHVLQRTRFIALQEGQGDAVALQALSEWMDELSSSPIDLLVNLFQDPIGSLITALLPCERCVGLQYDLDLGGPIAKDPWTRWLCAIPAERKANSLHAIDVYLRMAGCHPSAPPLAQQSSAPLQRPYPARFPLPSQNARIAIQPGSAWIGKCWPEGHWIQLLQALIAQTNWQFDLIGAPQEMDLCKRIAQAVSEGRTRVLAGATQLQDLPPLLAACQGILTGDTFAMHAAAGRCPILALFGPSNPIETGPYAPGAFVFQSPAPQAGNFDFQGQGPSSMAAISPAAILRFLVHGETTEGLLQASWDASSSMLVWSDCASGKRISSWAPCLMDEAPWPLPTHPSPLQSETRDLGLRLQQVLTSASAQGLTAGIAGMLDRLETEFSASAENISMELYRISRNSIPLHPLQQHLKSRQEMLTHLLDSTMDPG